MEDYNEDNLKNKEDLHIAVRDIFRFAVFSTKPSICVLKEPLKEPPKKCS